MVQQNSIFVLAMAQRCTLSDTLIIIIRNIRAFRDQTLQYPFQSHEAGHRVRRELRSNGRNASIADSFEAPDARSLCVNGARLRENSGTMSKPARDALFPRSI